MAILCFEILTNSQIVRNFVMPAKAGIQNYLKTLDSRLRGNDVKGHFRPFSEAFNIYLQLTITKDQF